MLEHAPLEDVVARVARAGDALAECDPDEVEALEVDLYHRVIDGEEWDDRGKAAAAFRWCLDVARDRELGDADTPTWLLMRAIELAPHDDALLLDYVRAAADVDYRSTSTSLADVAAALRGSERARTLRLVHTLVEYRVLRAYLHPGANPVHEQALAKAFRDAAAAGATAADWHRVRAWVEREIRFVQIPDDLWGRYAG